MRVLLVEDSRADADLLIDVLEDELPGIDVTVSVSIADAIPLLALPMDIAITDLSLPDAEGLQALTAILRARPDIAVVVMTGRRDQELALRALSEGAEDYLVKGAQSPRMVATAALYAAHRRIAETKAHHYETLALSLLDAMEAATCAIDRNGTVIAVNQTWREFGLHGGGDPERFGLGSNYFDVFAVNGSSEAGAAQVIAAGVRQVLSGQLRRFQRDYPVHNAEGLQWFSVRANALPDFSAVLSHVDMSGAKQTEHKLSHLSLHDSLTGLPNRELLNDRLAQALALTKRNQRSVAIAFLDIDQFKRINDSLGHPAGDELLRSVADRLSSSMRAGDTVARYAGDEFVVVWPNTTSPEEAVQLAQRLNRAMEEPFKLRAATLTVTASVGVAVGRDPRLVEELLLDADAAMYCAKDEGRGMTRIFTDELREGVASRLRMEDDLRVALRQGNFVLHYQPVVELRSRTVAGVEALVRWNHPGGLIMPDSFIPVAEASGLIVPLGDWVLHEACRQGAAWAAQGLDLQIAVNFSARQISHPDVVAGVRRTLSMSGMNPERLSVEVTESVVLQDPDYAERVFSKIRALGASVAIDDFGTGYSSLLYLKRYPVAALKADRQFVSGIGIGSTDAAIVASVIGLAHAVGAVCVAEGVETIEQYQALVALHCDYAQGYFFSRPVLADAVPVAVQHCLTILTQEPMSAVPTASRG